MNTRMVKITNKIILIVKRIITLPQKYFWIFINGKITKKGGAIILSPIYDKNDTQHKKIYNLILSIKKESKQLLSDFELLNIYTLIKKTENVRGNIAEVGVFKGGSAKVICESTNKHIYLFDTFMGLPKSSKQNDSERFINGEKYKSSYEEVKKYLSEYKNVSIYKGLFPLTSKPIKNKKFSLVHLDADLYESTLKSLQFFYTRMNKGGVIICHDYIGPGSLKGVKKAIDEFFKNKPELIIESLAGSSQCLIIKV